MKDFIEDVLVWATIIATSGFAIILGILVLAMPFIAIGLGIGVIGWFTCLVAPFC